MTPNYSESLGLEPEKAKAVSLHDFQMVTVIAMVILGRKAQIGFQTLIGFVNLDILFDISSFIFQLSLLQDIILHIHPTSQGYDVDQGS